MPAQESLSSQLQAIDYISSCSRPYLPQLGHSFRNLVSYRFKKVPSAWVGTLALKRPQAKQASRVMNVSFLGLLSFFD